MKKVILTSLSALVLLTISCETSRKSSLTSATTQPQTAEVAPPPPPPTTVPDSVSKYYVSKKHAAMVNSKKNPNAIKAPMTREEKRAMLAPEQPVKPKQR